PAAHPGLSLARKTNAGAGLDPGRNVDVERTVTFNPALSAAGVAGGLDDLPQARTGRAGALDGKETLLRPDLAHARTGRAGGGFAAAFGTGAVAGRTGHRRRHVDGLLDARER